MHSTAATRTIPFGRPLIGNAERDAVMEVLSQPILTDGPRVERFEAAFGSFTGAPHAVAASSCTAALHLALMAIGIGPGDEVIVPALAHVAAAHAVELVGATPIFVDSEPATGNLDLDRLEAAVTDHTQAVCVTHCLGFPVDMERLRRITDTHGLRVVEECAPAIGATLDGTHVGLHGDAGCFSFHPASHLAGSGGGMLITCNPDVASLASTQRVFGIDRTADTAPPIRGAYDVTHPGCDYRMTEIAATIGLRQMERLEGFIETRRANREMLARGLVDLDGVRPIAPGEGRFRDACYCCTLILEGRLAGRRSLVASRLAERGVSVDARIPRPVPHLTYYRRQHGFADSSFPVAARLCDAWIALPVGPHLESGDVDHVIASVREAVTDP